MISFLKGTRCLVNHRPRDFHNVVPIFISRVYVLRRNAEQRAFCEAIPLGITEIAVANAILWLRRPLSRSYCRSRGS